MRKTLCVASLLVLVAPGPSARQEYIVEPTSASEYPAWDRSLRSHELMGLRAKAAERAAQTAPDRAATFELLLKAGRASAALDVLNRIVERRPAEITAAFGAAASIDLVLSNNPSRDFADRLRVIVGAAKQRLARMPRDAAAELARALLPVEAATQRGPGTWREGLRAFAAEYRGTQAALLTEVDLLGERSGPERIAALDEFVREHPGTVAAAKATYLKGFDLASNGFSFGERAGHDPTQRFFRVVEIYTELRSGQYPPCEWVDKALSLISDFASYKPSYAAGNADKMLATYEGLLPILLERYESDRSQDRISSLIGYRMTALFRARGDVAQGIDAMFDRLERIARNPHAVRLLKAELYLRSWSSEAIEEEAAGALRGKVPAILESLARDASGFERRKAIATLATLRFNEGDDRTAARLYRAYVDAYPDSPYAWVAALRAAECEEPTNAKQAALMFRDVARRFGPKPFAQVLGHAYAGRALEAAGDFPQALAEYRSALAAWDPDYGERYALGSRGERPTAALALDGIEGQVTNAILTDAIADLERAMGTADGELVARGRWMLSHNRWNEAVDATAQFVAKHPTSPLSAEARSISHRARLEVALERADTEAGAPDVDAALGSLEALSAEPTDFAVVGAMIARATLLALTGTAADADDAMARAMDAWAALDRSVRPFASRDGLERDVVAIRNVVFRPRGDGVFGTSRGGWNAFQWRSATAPHLVVGSELRVKRHDGTLSRVNARDAFPGLENVLFLDAGRHAILERIMKRLGGSKRRVPTTVMQTPNQPAGAARDVQAFWKRSFFVQPGHWGGWVFETYPIISEIEFVDAARSRAAVRVTVGYSGATVLMEKAKDGTWVAMELTNFWIT